MAKCLLDTQQLVVLGDAIGAAHRTGLDLTGTGRSAGKDLKSFLDR
jgi:hypothetical protein